MKGQAEVAGPLTPRDSLTQSLDGPRPELPLPRTFHPACGAVLTTDVSSIASAAIPSVCWVLLWADSAGRPKAGPQASAAQQQLSRPI